MTKNSSSLSKVTAGIYELGEGFKLRLKFCEEHIECLVEMRGRMASLLERWSSVRVIGEGEEASNGGDQHRARARVLVKSQEMEFRAHQVYGKPLTPLKLEKT